MKSIKTKPGFLKRFLSRNAARWFVSAIITLMACALSIIPTRMIERLDRLVYDVRMQILPPILDPRIVIVDIDEKSLVEIGRWPWSRNIVADLMDKMTDQYKVRAVGFDVMFTEPDTSSGYGTLVALSQNELKDIPRIGERISALRPTLDFDGRLAKSLTNRPVVLGFFMSSNGQKRGLLPAPAFTIGDLKGYFLEAPEVKGFEANLEILQRAARGGGYINATEVDDDGVLRSIPMLIQVGNNFYESLALATARVSLGATKIEPDFLHNLMGSDQEKREYGVLESLKLNTVPKAHKIPVERNLRTRIQFRGTGGPHGGAFRYVSAADILKGRANPGVMAGSIILVGTSTPGLFDLRATPVSAEFPGVEIHANIIASILDGTFKTQPDYVAAIDILQILLLGLLLTISLSALTPVYSILFAFGTAAIVATINFWMYQSNHLVLPIATAWLLILTLFMFNLGWGYWFEFRKGRALVNRFQEYVAPELVAEMAENPDSYSMEGEERELTVMFADVRGFTTISESLQPNELREYVNAYLTAMSENIRDTHQGTLDKYIGDCVMAFWGAPVAFADHATRAVATAILMQATTRKLNIDFIARGWPPLKIGVGLNTGKMRVGDMGSKIRKAYTVMGDAVNLSSRLEGITKVYGVGIVVGEATKLAASSFAFRELDRVRVKGKNLPVSIFEPIGLDKDLTEAERWSLDQWHAALALFRAQKWDQAEELIRTLQQNNPDEGLYILYLSSITDLRENPPGADWDGVTTFKTK